MTIRIPKWALAVIGGIALLGIGVVLGVVLTEGGSDSDAAAELRCDQRTARIAIRKSSLAEELTSSPFALEDVFEFFTPELVSCSDLNGDGKAEMVVRLLGQTGAAPMPWAIFNQEGQEWKLALSRRSVKADLDVTNGMVRESTPAYAEGDATCCPSGKREGVVRWSGHSYRYRPLIGSSERRVVIAGSEAPAIAGLPTRHTAEPDATQVFGIPSLVTSLDSACHASWIDIGLEMVFADLGGANPCREQGSFVVAIFSGAEAEQAGWEIGGLHIGESVDKMFAAYPNASVGDRRYYSFLHRDQPGTPFILVSKRSPLGYGGRAPILTALALDGKILALDIHTGVIFD